MSYDLIAYLLFGTTLVLIFLFIIIFYYSKNRKNKVEAPKYKILEDDED
ncbi:CcoQ/FixQ family Cbb3-type cytochrome c oxidase assembly chaperone [Deferribacter thermophilus]